MFRTNEVESAIVVGAGTAGLIAAFELQQVKSSLGYSRGRPAWVTNGVPDIPSSRSTPTEIFLTCRTFGIQLVPWHFQGDAVVEHLQGFVAQQSMAIEFGVEVARIICC